MQGHRSSDIVKAISFRQPLAPPQTSSGQAGSDQESLQRMIKVRRCGDGDQTSDATRGGSVQISATLGMTGKKSAGETHGEVGEYRAQRSRCSKYTGGHQS